jgi:hypothetical protein
LEILEHVAGSEVAEKLVNNGHPVTQQGFWRDGKLTKKIESWDCDSLYNFVSVDISSQIYFYGYVLFN